MTPSLGGNKLSQALTNVNEKNRHPINSHGSRRRHVDASRVNGSRSRQNGALHVGSSNKNPDAGLHVPSRVTRSGRAGMAQRDETGLESVDLATTTNRELRDEGERIRRDLERMRQEVGQTGSEPPPPDYTI